MADYPLPKFHFKVDLGGTEIGFTEVSGLDVETEVIEYREGSSPKYSTIKMPGMQKNSDITLKKGTFNSDNQSFDAWKKTVFFQEGESTGSMYRMSVTISLLDENHAPIVVWKLTNAWISKLQSTDLNSTSGTDVAVETIVLVHEGLEISNT